MIAAFEVLWLSLAFISYTKKYKFDSYLNASMTLNSQYKNVIVYRNDNYIWPMNIFSQTTWVQAGFKDNNYHVCHCFNRATKVSVRSTCSPEKLVEA